MTDPSLPRRELQHLTPPAGAFDDVVARARRRKAGNAAAGGSALLLSAVGVALTVLLPGGSSGGQDRVIDGASPQPSATETQQATPTTGPPANQEPTASPTAAGAETPQRSLAVATPSTSFNVRTVSSDETYYFNSPSGNIACDMVGDAVACHIREADYEPPAKPADCEYDYGQAVGLRGSNAAEFLCVSDTAYSTDNPELAYGEQVTNGRVTCTSTRTAMSCANASGTHGFELARARYRLF